MVTPGYCVVMGRGRLAGRTVYYDDDFGRASAVVYPGSFRQGYLYVLRRCLREATEAEALAHEVACGGIAPWLRCDHPVLTELLAAHALWRADAAGDDPLRDGRLERTVDLSTDPNLVRAHPHEPCVVPLDREDLVSDLDDGRPDAIPAVERCTEFVRLIVGVGKVGQCKGRRPFHDVEEQSIGPVRRYLAWLEHG